jgi:hypothetical protein
LGVDQGNASTNDQASRFGRLIPDAQPVATTQQAVPTTQQAVDGISSDHASIQSEGVLPQRCTINMPGEQCDLSVPQTQAASLDGNANTRTYLEPVTDRAEQHTNPIGMGSRDQTEMILENQNMRFSDGTHECPEDDLSPGLVEGSIADDSNNRLDQNHPNMDTKQDNVETADDRASTLMEIDQTNEHPTALPVSDAVEFSPMQSAVPAVEAVNIDAGCHHDAERPGSNLASEHVVCSRLPLMTIAYSL